MSANASADFKAQVTVRSARSQGFLVTLGLSSLAPVFLAAGLLFVGQPFWWAFLLFAGLMLLGTGLAWMRSQSDSDLHDAPSTAIELPDGTKFTTDSRNLRSERAAVVIEGMLQVVTRKPLPPPSGKVDERGVPVPNSAAQAAIEVTQINAQVEHQRTEVLDTLGARLPELPSALQEAGGGAPSTGPLCELPPQTEKVAP